MIEIPYGSRGYLPVPLVASGTEAFLDGPTLAAGDAKIWTDQGILANVGAFGAAFSAGRTRPSPGDEIYRAGASSQTAKVVAFIHTSGAFASTTAVGILYASNLSTNFSSGTIGITGGTSAAFETSTSLASGLIFEIDRGHVAVPYTSSEMTCKLGFLLVEDASTTKLWMDQSIPFITKGHPSAFDPFASVPIAMGILSSASTGSVLEVSSGIASSQGWTGGVLHIVKDGVEAHPEAGRSIVASSSGGDIVIEPGYITTPTTGWGVYMLPGSKAPSSSGPYLPKVDTLRIAGARVTGIGTSSDQWDGSTDVV